MSNAPNEKFIPRHEAMRQKYYMRPYLKDASDSELAERFRHIMLNLSSISPEGKIGPNMKSPNIHYWTEPFTHIIEEYNRRGGLPAGILDENSIPKVTHPDQPTGYKILNGKPAPEPPCAIKLGHKQHMEEMYKKGRILIRPASDYNDPSLNPAIQDDELWKKAQSIRKRNSGHKSPCRHRRPQKLFSGLLKCGKCGGPMIIIGQERYGCSHRRERGSCDNAHSIRVELLETRVLEGMRSELVQPEVLATFIKEFHAKLKAARAEKAQHRIGLERKLAETQKKIDGIMASIMDGMYHASLKEKMTELEAAKAKLEAELTELQQPNVLEIHPNLGKVYARKIEKLIQALNGNEDTRLQAIAVLRSIVEKIAIYPTKKKGKVEIEIHGEMATILHFAKGDSAPLETTMTKLVAGVGFEPTTFRL